MWDLLCGLHSVHSQWPSSRSSMGRRKRFLQINNDYYYSICTQTRIWRLNFLHTAALKLKRVSLMYNANSMKEKLVPYQNQSAQQKVYNTKNYAYMCSRGTNEVTATKSCFTLIRAHQHCIAKHCGDTKY